MLGSILGSPYLGKLPYISTHSDTGSVIHRTCTEKVSVPACINAFFASPWRQDVKSCEALGSQLQQTEVNKLDN